MNISSQMSAMENFQMLAIFASSALAAIALMTRKDRGIRHLLLVGRYRPRCPRVHCRVGPLHPSDERQEDEKWNPGYGRGAGYYKVVPVHTRNPENIGPLKDVFDTEKANLHIKLVELENGIQKRRREEAKDKEQLENDAKEVRDRLDEERPVHALEKERYERVHAREKESYEREKAELEECHEREMRELVERMKAEKSVAGPSSRSRESRQHR
ncbi:hypothetical protein Hypma_001459 [Hypsizygus marmoreus]|uniref:Uncharacterized protein n=1 Tax=Hypsizygus marmoreus TaxID=39966 RepID=A0A369KBE5_HYPMA|nr:hypothetical protein Hypma_001459 [Hypsizygus marmoreus]